MNTKEMAKDFLVDPYDCMPSDDAAYLCRAYLSQEKKIEGLVEAATRLAFVDDYYPDLSEACEDVRQALTAYKEGKI